MKKKKTRNKRNVFILIIGAILILGTIIWIISLDTEKPVDLDGDGFFNNEDCNDSNNLINPDMDEICDNNQDDNCNNQIDEGCVDCGYKITEDGATLELNKDLLNCEQFGIMINAKDVTIDCQGHKITGILNNGFPSGNVYDSTGKEDCSLSLVLNQKVGASAIAICRGIEGGYHIKNCIFEDGFSSKNYGGAIANYNQHPKSQAGIIENNTFYNVGRGIMQWGEFDSIKDNEFSDLQDKEAIFLDESSGNIIEGNVFKNSEWYGGAVFHYCGPYCDYKENPTIFRDNLFENNKNAVYFQTAGTGYIDDVLENNIFTNNNQDILIQETSDIKLTCTGNTKEGADYDCSTI